MIRKLSILLLAASIGAPATAQSWNAFNAQYLYASDFELGHERVGTLTLAWANGWTYGDSFTFADVTRFGRSDNKIYAEWSPRLSLSKITGKDFSAGPIEDVLWSGTLEWGENVSNYLMGAAVDLAVPGFNFFRVNGYLRENPDLPGSTWQTTVTWSADFEVGFSRWSFSGFIDWAGSEGKRGTSAYSKRNLHAQPQLLLDAGHLFGRQGLFHVGVEWLYWHNKYGIPGVYESVAQAMVKVNF